MRIRKLSTSEAICVSIRQMPIQSVYHKIAAEIGFGRLFSDSLIYSVCVYTSNFQKRPLNVAIIRKFVKPMTPNIAETRPVHTDFKIAVRTGL